MLSNSQQMMEETFANELGQYIGQTLHEKIKFRDIRGTLSVPVFLDRAYYFLETRISSTRCVLMVARKKAATPSEIAKHVSLARKTVDAVTVFAASSLNAYNRSRLIAQGVPFVVPGNQLYLPELAMDLREHFIAPKPQAPQGLSPAAQALLFHHLLRLNESATTPTALAKCLGYSSMSVGRAFNELTISELAAIQKRGREKHIQFDADRRDLFKSALPLLHNPARSIKYLGNGRLPSMMLGGETALAKLTELSPPKVSTFIVAASEWKAMAKKSGLVEVGEDEASVMVETWFHDPAALSRKKMADPLSLYVQFHNHGDERVAMEAEKLLEKISW